MNEENVDNSNNIINVGENSAYRRALRNVFQRVLMPQPNTQYTNYVYPNNGGLPPNLTNYSPMFNFSNLPPQDDALTNLLLTTINQKNSYKKIISEKGRAQIINKKFETTMKNDKCPIILETFAIGEEVSILPCEHVFNVVAINEWLETGQANCPVCRFALDSKEVKLPTITPASEDEYNSDSDMPPLEDDDEEQAETTPQTTSDLFNIFERLLQLRNQQRNTPSGIINDYDNNRDVQAAILASINEINSDIETVD